jgi:CRISPR-associated endoribonuclease Cas6
MTTFNYELGVLRFRLHALKETFIDQHMGRAVQQFGLTLIGDSNPDLAKSIHDQTAEKPFTVSPLMRGKMGVKGKVSENDELWIQLTALNAPLVLALEMYRRTSPTMIELDRQHWRVEGVSWTHLSSYQQLMDAHRHSTPREEIAFLFASAATFRSNGVNMPLPTPSLVFGSLLSRWDTFTSHRLHDMPREQVMAFINHHLLLSRHKIETVLYRGKQGGKEIGFVGQATYDLTRKSEHLEKHDPQTEALLRKEYVWMARTINLLCDFAVFSGVGRKTTTGMGMILSDERSI